LDFERCGANARSATSRERIQELSQEGDETRSQACEDREKGNAVVPHSSASTRFNARNMHFLIGGPRRPL
jgi:hypothetical protein